MLIRYKKDSKGNSIQFAKIYTKDEHKINLSYIDNDALRAIRKLQATGAEAYIVGGAVRDLLLNKKPKDFDITTSASPRQIHKLFWNSRIIGKRFKLVHLEYENKILEVSTFRSEEENFGNNNNVFGTVEQDAKRRDFTINALYYDPINEQVLDFNNAMEDFKKKKISSIIDLKTTFIEDPVRMLRAVKYSVTTDFKLRWDVRRAIKRDHCELAKVSTSRLTEEVNKILSSGYSRDIFIKLKKYKLLVYLLPCFNLYASLDTVQNSLLELDYKIRQYKIGEGEEIKRSIMLLHLVKELIIFSNETLTARERFKETFRQVKVLISPMTPSNYEVELCCAQLLNMKGYKVPKGCVRHPKTASPNKNFERRRKYIASKKRTPKKFDNTKRKKKPNSQNVVMN
ncbi:MAG: polynucleotide adenylyltransferase PcnB [Pleomorphochaeta sp.]